MTRDVHPGSGARIRILIFSPSRIPDPEVKKAQDPRSRIRIRNTGCRGALDMPFIRPEVEWCALVYTVRLSENQTSLVITCSKPWGPVGSHFKQACLPLIVLASFAPSPKLK
jgi:hypothetical protein